MSPFDEIDMVGKLADLKEDAYRTTLFISAVAELLIEKGLLTREEIAAKAAELSARDER